MVRMVDYRRLQQQNITWRNLGSNADKILYEPDTEVWRINMRSRFKTDFYKYYNLSNA